MTNQGFNIDIFVDWDTGLLFGGNKWNCGTWMDKMGESQKAGNKGVPTTSRDGAAVEIIGLLKSCLRWVSELWEQSIFKYEGVTVKSENSIKSFANFLEPDGSSTFITWKEWNDKIQESFELCYYVPSSMISISEEVIDFQVRRKMESIMWILINAITEVFTKIFLDPTTDGRIINFDPISPSQWLLLQNFLIPNTLWNA
jgi:glycogen debranching enzyme